MINSSKQIFNSKENEEATAEKQGPRPFDNIIKSNEIGMDILI